MLLTKFKNVFLTSKVICNYSYVRWNSSSIDYEILKITAKDKEKIFDFLKVHYYPDEPMSKAFGGAVSDVEIEAKTPQITSGLSRMAVEKKTNKLLGVTLNEIYTKEMSDSFRLKIEQSDKNDPYIHFLKLCKRLDDESKFWEKIGVNSCLRNATICIDKKYRGMKIAYNLLKSVETVSDEEYLRGESTEYDSYNILLKLGWKTIYEINFHDYRDENDQIIINTQPPNTHLRLVVYKTNKKKGPVLMNTT